MFSRAVLPFVCSERIPFQVFLGKTNKNVCTRVFAFSPLCSPSFHVHGLSERGTYLGRGLLSHECSSIRWAMWSVRRLP